MKKKLVLLTFLLSSFSSRGQEVISPLPYEVLGRIELKGSTIRLIQSEEGHTIPSMLKNISLRDDILKLRTGDEALIKGHISYVPSTVEEKTKLHPVFVIESIRPISLRMIGTGEMKIQDPPLTGNLTATYSPLAIPVTTDVASALTLTGSLLLMQSLTASQNEPQVRQQINSGLILFAGVLATSAFIYEQITETKKKKP